MDKLQSGTMRHVALQRFYCESWRDSSTDTHTHRETVSHTHRQTHMSHTHMSSGYDLWNVARVGGIDNTKQKGNVLGLAGLMWSKRAGGAASPPPPPAAVTECAFA